ncbi:MAG: 16S rRNA (cytosine(1402)-N(4))-methyltransferase RsmH [Patescibacteria group bacterium]
MRHTPVLLKEVIEGLGLDRPMSAMSTQTGEKSERAYPTVIDCNLGDGGHSEAIVDKLEGKVKIVGFDLDGDAIDRATTNIFSLKVATSGNFGKDQFVVFRRNFKFLKEACAEVGIANVQGILFDLGLSSYELDESGRGFSFRKNEPLSMTFGASQDHVFTASDIVNTWAEEHIEAVIRGYGEDRFAGRIAGAIVRARGKRLEGGQPEHPINTTFELAALVRSAVPIYRRFGKIHPATQTFQAFRIAVNDELTAIEEALPQAFELLAPGGRLVVMSYHSLEDRIVKRYFKSLIDPEDDKEPLAKALTKKPTTPSEAELLQNPRSRSVKLRIIEKL